MGLVVLGVIALVATLLGRKHRRGPPRDAFRESGTGWEPAPRTTQRSGFQPAGHTTVHAGAGQVVPLRRGTETGTVLQGTCYVVDGDTIKIGGTSIRLAGIDAPEMDQPYGRNAKNALFNLCKGQVVRAKVTGKDDHDRVVARCYLPDGRDLAAEMVRTGHAIDWAKHSGGRYRHLEVEGIRKRLWRCDARQKGRFPPVT